MPIDTHTPERNNGVMAEPAETPLVKLICGVISSSVELMAEMCERLTAFFGPIDVTSELFPFDFTDYYSREMGTGLLRQFVAFQCLIEPAALVEAKLQTNALEAEVAAASSDGPPRPVNLDPGYVEESKLVLASMKNFSHRICMGRKVYAEITLMYRKGRWQKLQWTFPDYASGRYDRFLLDVRNRLRDQLREHRK